MEEKEKDRREKERGKEMSKENDVEGREGREL